MVLFWSALACLVFVALWGQPVQNWVQRLGGFSNPVTHVFGFLLLSLSAFLAYGAGATIVALLIGLGLVVEGLQFLTPTRTPALSDASVSAAGVIAALVLYRLSAAQLGRRRRGRAGRDPAGGPAGDAGHHASHEGRAPGPQQETAAAGSRTGAAQASEADQPGHRI